MVRGHESEVRGKGECLPRVAELALFSQENTVLDSVLEHYKKTVLDGVSRISSTQFWFLTPDF